MILEERLIKRIEIPEGVQFELGETVVAKGPKGEVNKQLDHPSIKITLENNQVVIKPIKLTKKEKTLVNTFTAHIKNMIKGVTEGFIFKLKICSGHFPMSVNVNGNQVIVKNFLGEKVPRVARIMPETKVEINSDEILVSSLNKEFAGQTAANIEQSTRITNKCKTRFQDGIWITEKAGRVM
jgi:large subunit ribosomal protein L6